MTEKYNLLSLCELLTMSCISALWFPSDVMMVDDNYGLQEPQFSFRSFILAQTAALSLYWQNYLRIVCVLFHVVSDVQTGDMIP